MRQHSNRHPRPVKSTRSATTTAPKYSCGFRVLSDRLLADVRITPAGKLVLMALQSWGFGKDHCHPAVETIARAAGLGESTARRSLLDLAGLGLIRLEPDPTNKTGKRIVRLWMADRDLHPHRIGPDDLGCQNETQGEPPASLGVKMAPDLGCQNETPALGVKKTPERTLLRKPIERTSSTMTTMTGSSSSSGPDGVDSQEAKTNGAYEKMAAEGIVYLFPSVTPRRATLTVREFGARNVFAAGMKFRPAGRRNEWGFFRGICKNIRDEGGDPGGASLQVLRDEAEIPF